MSRSPFVAAAFAWVLALSACAPPQDDPQAEADAEEILEADTASADAAQEPAAAPEPKPEPAPRPAAPRPKPAPVAAAKPPPVCNECGTVASIELVKEKGQGSGAGAVMGAIAGGVIGHQFGSGSGNDLATAAGAIAGGFGGHEAEKRVRATNYYRVGVNMENGSYQTVNVTDPAGISTGTKVRVSGGNIHLR